MLDATLLADSAGCQPAVASVYAPACPLASAPSPRTAHPSPPTPAPARPPAGAWSTTPTVWSNEYFKNLFDFEWDQTQSPAGQPQWKPFARVGSANPDGAHRVLAGSS